MARDERETEDLTEGTHEPRECMACRGTGRVISNLGGSLSAIECPWCGGSALRAVGLDAQARWGSPEADELDGDPVSVTPAQADEPPA